MSAAEPARPDQIGNTRPFRRSRVTAGAVGAVMLVGIGLTACSGVPTQPVANETAAPATAAPDATAMSTSAPDPMLLSDGTAAENLVYFNSLAAAVTKQNAAAGGRAYIDALVAGGFDRSAMELTFDRTQADLAADAVQFSVRFAGECLIGQIGPASDGFHSMVAPILSTGLCLVGATRQIDW